MRAHEMLNKADQCEALADTTASPAIADTLRELARQWRDMAYQSERLERQLAREIIRNPTG
jgi:hypothetical protein